MDLHRWIQIVSFVVIAAGSSFLIVEQAPIEPLQAQEEDECIDCDWYYWSFYQDCHPCDGVITL